MFSSVKRQPVRSTFAVIFGCEQSTGILPPGRNCCQTMIGERMPTAEPQPISDHFRPALFFVVRPHCSINDCKAWAASHPGPPQQGSEGWRLKELSTGSLTAQGGWTLYWGMAFRRPYLCPKIRSESKTVPGRLIREEGWHAVLAGMKIHETACLKSRLLWWWGKVRLNGLKTYPEWP